jgi:vacuolar-type H+-ATPase subunit E/Vma4
MALDDLVARLEQDADAQVDAIAREANAEIAAIDAATTQALSARTKQSLDAGRTARQAAFERALADARRAARARELAATHAVIDRVFARALALLPEMSATEPWSRSWPALVREALSYIAAPCRVRCAPHIAAAIRDSVAPGSPVTIVEDASIGPGLVVEAADGSVTVDATLAGRLAQRRAHLAIGLILNEDRDA